MEPTDRDPEHCVAEACLAECGCACKECRATVKFMAECGNDVPTLDPQKRVRELDLQIKDALFALGRFEVQGCPCGARPETPNTHPHVLGCHIEEAIVALEGRGAKKRVGESPTDRPCCVEAYARGHAMGKASQAHDGGLSPHGLTGT